MSPSIAPRVCLNMIVKNEAANLPRCLKSTIGYVHAMIVYDTGSTDDTVSIVKAHCKEQGIHCRVFRGEFVNFEFARNLALRAAQASPKPFEYILLMDADMELKMERPWPALTAEAYAVVQRQGGMAYHNVRLVRKGSKARYYGVTHEYLSVDETVTLPAEDVWFADHATGSNRGEKYERDTRLLEGHLALHPADPRSLFYLAQTYRDAGHHELAIARYNERIGAGGWDEEVWYSRLQIARSYRELGQEAEFIRMSLAAYNARPSRAEPLYDLAKYFREKPDQQQTGWLFADIGAKITYPTDLLFVEQYVYDYGFIEEKSILGCYNDATRAAGAAAADKLSLMAAAPAVSREGARRNLYFYLKPLKDYAPSFMAQRIPDINPDKTYVNTNPSIAVVDGQLKAIVRTVSYRIRPDGSYDYNGLASIRTTNFLADIAPLGGDGDIAINVRELKRPVDFPAPVTTEVLDIEDLRLFPHRGELYASGTVLEQNPQFWREMFLFKVDAKTGALSGWGRMKPDFLPKCQEKNWMPILMTYPTDIYFMYRPGVVMNSRGVCSTAKDPPGLALDQIAGGGQVVPVDAGWLAIVHEARPDPTTGKRFYQHRFMWYDDTFTLMKISRPFVFFDKQIEFAAGFAILGPDLFVSFGVRDCEAWVAKLSMHELRAFIWS